VPRSRADPRHTAPRHSHPPSLLTSPPSQPHPNRTRPPQRENPPRITLPVVIRLASHSRQQIPSPSATHCHHHCHFAPSAHPRDTPLGTHRSERSTSFTTPRCPHLALASLAHRSPHFTARSRPTPLRTHPTVTQPAVHSLVNHPRHPEHREMRGPGLVHGPPHVDGKIFHGYFRLSRGVSERVSERASAPPERIDRDSADPTIARPGTRSPPTVHDFRLSLSDAVYE